MAAMRSLLRLFAIAAVFIAASIGWVVLGGVMSSRAGSQSYELRSKVADLWGQRQAQTGPALTFEWNPTREVSHTVTEKGVVRTTTERVVSTETEKRDVSIAATKIDVDLHLDQRLKGLVWYSLYDVGFQGGWSYVHEEKEAGKLHVSFRFPDVQGMYDAFTFVIDGTPQDLRPKDGAIEAIVPVAPGQRVEIAVAYKSRGLDEWSYVPTTGVASLKSFHLGMTTDFPDIDFPSGAMSPSAREHAGSGWKLAWNFDRVVTGHNIGMAMPTKVQPGQLAAALSFSAPISLLFFFVILLALGRLRGLDLHPINYLFLGAAFFSFHLLFAYTVDHLHVVPAFVLSSVTSVLLVVSYLRLVVSPRFAFLEAGGAQLVYLVGFSLAHFWEGFTGLAVTVMSILTLFLLMQLTGRIRWGGAVRPVSASGPAPLTEPVTD
jgi:inner membrane protein involved in colicin E2 resistance